MNRYDAWRLEQGEITLLEYINLQKSVKKTMDFTEIDKQVDILIAEAKIRFRALIEKKCTQAQMLNYGRSVHRQFFAGLDPFKWDDKPSQTAVFVKCEDGFIQRL